MIAMTMPLNYRVSEFQGKNAAAVRKFLVAECFQRRIAATGFCCNRERRENSNQPSEFNGEKSHCFHNAMVAYRVSYFF